MKLIELQIYFVSKKKEEECKVSKKMILSKFVEKGKNVLLSSKIWKAESVHICSAFKTMRLKHFVTNSIILLFHSFWELYSAMIRSHKVALDWSSVYVCSWYVLSAKSQTYKEFSLISDKVHNNYPYDFSQCSEGHLKTLSISHANLLFFRFLPNHAFSSFVIDFSSSSVSFDLKLHFLLKLISGFLLFS